MDASNLLKPMLARGELHTIGATTLDEYRKHIEKDAALERRFQPVFVDQPTRRGDDLDPARPARALRGPPRRAHHRLGAGRRGGAVATATSPSASCPTRRSTSSTRPPAGCAWRWTPCPSSSTSSSAGASSSRSSARRCARRRTTRRGRGSRRSRRSSPTIGERAGALKSAWEQEKGAIRRSARTKSELEGLQVEIEQAERAAELRARRRAQVRHASASCSERLAPAGGGAGRAPGRPTRCSRKRSTRTTSRDIVVDAGPASR